MMAKINWKTINPFGAWCRDLAKETCCIDTSDRPSFVRAYIESTKLLAESLKQYCEHFCPPLAFMIRHSIELLLKNELLTKCNKGFDGVMKNNHNLKLLMDELVCDTNLFDYIDKAEIENFHKHDKNSFEFRYPVTKKNTSTCDGLCCFGINEVIKLCDNMLIFLDNEYPVI